MNESERIFFSLDDITRLAVDNCMLFSAMLELNTTCNFRCKHCYIPNHNNRGMSTEAIYSLLSQLRAAGVFELTLTGGEIFTRDDIFNIIKEIRRMGFNLVLFSNMSLISENGMRLLCEYKINLLSCTIFSMDDKIHDAITQVEGSLKSTLQNIRLAKRHNIPLEVKTMTMKENMTSIKGISKFCEEAGLGFKPDFIIYQKTDGDASVQEHMLDDEEIRDIIDLYDSWVGFQKHKDLSNEYMCPSTRSSIFIDAQGNIYPCNRLNINLGNSTSDSISAIWCDNSVLTKIRNSTWNDLSECAKCDANAFCVRCAGNAMEETGDLTNKAPLSCRTAFLRKRIERTVKTC